MNKKYKKHGYATNGISKIYRRWYQMNDRCSNPKNKDYKYYGGRGIKVCRRWQISIHSFIDDMGLPPVNTSLDRVDNSKGYSKENCRWATRTEQMNNTRYLRRIMYKGELKTIKEVAKIMGVKPHTLWSRHFRKKLTLNI